MMRVQTETEMSVGILFNFEMKLFSRPVRLINTANSKWRYLTRS
jgi:hypothetical protein